MRRLLFTALFLHSTLLLGSSQLDYAQFLFNDALYPEAAIEYSKLLNNNNLEESLQPDIRYQLALSHYHNRDYDQTIALLADSLHPEDIYLKNTCI